MKKNSLILLLFIFCGIVKMHGAAVKSDTVFITLSSDTSQADTLKQERTPHAFFPKKENKKLIAAILAFPVPFGFLGLHRIYLGAEPWVPVVYLVTAGGGLILPMLDFIAIVCADKDTLKSYENNNKLFMWVK